MKRVYIRIIDFLATKRRNHCKLSIMTAEETLNYILAHKASVSRYGDGELDIMFMGGGIGFQSFNNELKEKLLDVMKYHSNNLIVCIPRTFVSVAGLNERARQYWNLWYFRGVFSTLFITRWIFKNSAYEIFGDSLFSRPYMDYIDKRNASLLFPKIKMLWENRTIILLEGKESRLGVGNDLFFNSKSIKRIICPSKNAFSKYDSIVSTTLKFATTEDLILIALGPTATILARDFSDYGFQAIDIGHVDIEYEWFKRNAKGKTVIEGKFVNEVNNNQELAECYNSSYQSSILCYIE